VAANPARVVLRSVVVIAMLGIAAFWSYEAAESPTSQIFGKTVVSGPSNERVVALTYDDGPNPPYTDEILRVLEAERVRATFFVVGRAVEAYPSVVRREVRDGDAIGNHTWDHAHLIVMDPDGVRESLTRTDAAIAAATGVHPAIMRPPFGARDWIVLDQARKLGYTPIMWSVPLARDWENPAPSVIAARVLPSVTDGSIIVLHDGNRGLICGGARLPPKTCDRSSNVEATRLIVESLKAQGYRFVTIPELLALKRSTHTSAPGTE
jgi:peptidoglycan/xylan/chitin deacetylase (PgdA/CDA1 family)